MESFLAAASTSPAAAAAAAATADPSSGAFVPSSAAAPAPAGLAAAAAAAAAAAVNGGGPSAAPAVAQAVAAALQPGLAGVADDEVAFYTQHFKAGGSAGRLPARLLAAAAAAAGPFLCRAVTLTVPPAPPPILPIVIHQRPPRRPNRPISPPEPHTSHPGRPLPAARAARVEPLPLCAPPGRRALRAAAARGLPLRAVRRREAAARVPRRRPLRLCALALRGGRARAVCGVRAMGTWDDAAAGWGRGGMKARRPPWRSCNVLLLCHPIPTTNSATNNSTPFPRHKTTHPPRRTRTVLAAPRPLPHRGVPVRRGVPPPDVLLR